MWPRCLRCEDTMRWMEEAPADGGTHGTVRGEAPADGGTVARSEEKLQLMARSVMALLEAASQRGGRPGVSAAAMLYKLP